jgi:ubiquinone biosynthesis protein COQ4
MQVLDALPVLRDRIAFARTLVSFVDLVRHPDHLDRVFEIADGMVAQRTEVLGAMADHFRRDPRGEAALRDRPRLRFDLAALDRLAEGTTGRAFADHMRRNGLDPADIPTLTVSDELDFVRAHLYETHDVWHAITGFDTDVAGELGLQAFYAAQGPGGLPWMLLAMGFLNTALYAMQDRDRRFDAIARGWEMGKRARPLFGVRWDELWTTPIDEVRRTLGVEPYVPRSLLRAA